MFVAATQQNNTYKKKTPTTRDKINRVEGACATPASSMLDCKETAAQKNMILDSRPLPLSIGEAGIGLSVLDLAVTTATQPRRPYD